MKPMTHKEVLAESAAWIRANPNAMLHDVPDDLLEAWISEDPYAPEGFHVSVFSFGYFQQQLIRSNGREVEVTTVAMMEQFKIWQLKLGLLLEDRRSDQKVCPMSLFDSPKGETIKIWRVEAGARNLTDR